MNERQGLRLVIGLYAIFGLGYSLLMPMWEAPDEPDHYIVVLSVARTGEFPPFRLSTEVNQPRLYYWLASRFVLVLDRIDPSLANYYSPKRLIHLWVPQFDWTHLNHRFLWAPHLLRWINLALGGLTLLLIFRAVRRFAPDSPTPALATVSLIGLTPQFLHISASVSNDPLANLAGAYLFWQMSVVLSKPLRPRDAAISIVAAIAMPIVCKLTVLPMSFALLMSILWQSRNLWRDQLRRMLSVTVLAIVSGIVAPLLFPTTATKLWLHLRGRLFGVRYDAFDYFNHVLNYFPESYWGSVGWVSVSLPDELTYAMTAWAMMGAVASLRLLLGRDRVAENHMFTLMMSASILIVAAAAWANSWLASAWAVVLIWLLQRSFRRSGPITLTRKADWSFVWICIGVTVASVLKNLLSTPQAQGRFVFPAIGAICLVVTSGWLVLVPPRVTRFVPHFILTAMAGVNLMFWHFFIIPIYYQHFLDG